MQVERVRRVNEPCEETALRVVVECVQCGYVIEAGGISLGQRWLHLSCVEDYIMMLERARDRALVDNDALRAAVAAQPTYVWGSGGSAAIPSGWVQVPWTGAGGGGTSGGTIIYTATSTAAVAPNVYNWTTAATTATVYPKLITTTTSSGLFDSS